MATREAIIEPSGTLAEHLREAHRWSMLEYMRAVARWRPAVGATSAAVAGGVALYSGASAFSVAVGAGWGRPVTAAELDQIEHFYHRRGVAAAVEVCPASDPSLLALLRARQYAVREFTHLLYIDFNEARAEDDGAAVEAEETAADAAAGIELRWAGAAESAFLVDLMAQLFYERDPGPEARADIEARLSARNSLNVIAVVGGRWAGAAGGLLAAPAQIAVLSCSATLPEFRRRGVHAALLKFRLGHARRQGCRGAMVAATPGSNSERNLERHGFKLFCEKRIYVK